MREYGLKPRKPRTGLGDHYPDMAAGLRARRSPDVVAVVDGEGWLTAGKLARRSGRLVRRLRQLGVGPESRVALVADRSLAQVVGLFGILQAGGAYVPLDSALPRERLALLLADVQAGTAAPVLLVQAHLVERLPERPGHRLLLEDPALFAATPAGGPAEPAPVASSGNAAYVIFTSGSTGMPKGVVVEHRQVTDYVRGLHSRLGFARRRASPSYSRSTSTLRRPPSSRLSSPAERSISSPRNRRCHPTLSSPTFAGTPSTA
jgi:non-ribosomal peptide synthetase component F